MIDVDQQLYVKIHLYYRILKRFINFGQARPNHPITRPAAVTTRRDDPPDPADSKVTPASGSK
jgi:hypothetical protein